MHIEFSPASLTLAEARGVVALILAMHPDAGSSASDTVVMTNARPITAASLDDEAPPAPQFFAPVAAPPPQPSVTTTGPAVTAPTASPSDPVTLDAAGLPWDARIHSSGKTTVKDGTWRAKGGVGADTVAAVTAELRQLYPAPASTPAVTAPPPPAATAPVADPDPVAAFAAPAPPPPPVAAPTPPPPPATAPGAPPIGSEPTNFPTLLKAVTDATNGGKLTQSDIDTCLGQFGLTSMRDFAKPDNAQHIPEFWAMARAYIDQAG